eukprot:scpid27208/ scgid17578/ 
MKTLLFNWATIPLSFKTCEQKCERPGRHLLSSTQSNTRMIWKVSSSSYGGGKSKVCLQIMSLNSEFHVTVLLSLWACFAQYLSLCLFLPDCFRPVILSHPAELCPRLCWRLCRYCCAVLCCAVLLLLLIGCRDSSFVLLLLVC